MGGDGAKVANGVTSATWVNKYLSLLRFRLMIVSFATRMTRRGFYKPPRGGGGGREVRSQASTRRICSSSLTCKMHNLENPSTHIHPSTVHTFVLNNQPLPATPQAPSADKCVKKTLSRLFPSQNPRIDKKIRKHFYTRKGDIRDDFWGVWRSRSVETLPLGLVQEVKVALVEVMHADVAVLTSTAVALARGVGRNSVL